MAAHSPEVALDGNSEEEAARHTRIEAAEVESVGIRSRTAEAEVPHTHRCMEAEVTDSDTAYAC